MGFFFLTEGSTLFMCSLFWKSGNWWLSFNLGLPLNMKVIKRIMNRIPTMWKKEENSLKTKERGGSIGFSDKVWLVYSTVIFDFQGST